MCQEKCPMDVSHISINLPKPTTSALISILSLRGPNAHAVTIEIISFAIWNAKTAASVQIRYRL